MLDSTNQLNDINPFSRSVVHLTMDFDECTISTGTGFLRRRAGELFLITAWHNLTGREPQTLIPKHSMGSLPNHVRIEGFKIDRRLPLYLDGDPHDEETCLRCFWQHPRGPSIDVAVLRIQPPEDGYPIDEAFFDPKRDDENRMWVSQPCIVIGFPQELADRSQTGHVLPIYKGAQIASEPYIDFQGRPVVVIDATTRPGMSGAPVFTQVSDWEGVYVAGRFLGIYAGRYRDSGGGEDSALGYVYKPAVIAEIIDGINPNQEPNEKGFAPEIA